MDLQAAPVGWAIATVLEARAAQDADDGGLGLGTAAVCSNHGEASGSGESAAAGGKEREDDTPVVHGGEKKANTYGREQKSA
jgi:hypothetical protein